jgi:predicted amidohydrolase
MPTWEEVLRIALLHIAPVTGDIEHNRKLVERGVVAAAEAGAHWAITPELCIPGYLFLKKLGTGWIQPQPDQWMTEFCGLAHDNGITVFLSHPELDPASGRMYNTVFAINADGEIVGRHRKIKALGGAEAWSTGGWKISPYKLDGVQTGVLICADAYKNDVAEVLVSKGAQLLVSPVSWGPGGCGPDGEWEARSAQTGLPIVVCNRTGVEPDELDYREAESVVAQNGKRLLEATSDRSVVLMFDWDMETMTLQSEDFQRTYL